MREVSAICLLCVASIAASAQVPATPEAVPGSPARVAADAPPSASGVGKVARIADELQRATEHVKRLQTRLPDWAAVSWYADENKKLGPPAPGEDRVVFLGDSITHNWANAKYSDYFTRKHDGFVPIGRGIGGQNVAQMLVRMRQDVIDLHADSMVIFAGTNDLPTYKVPDLLRFIEGNFLSIFDLADAHKIHVVVCSILPVNDVTQPRTVTRRPEDMKLNAWLRQTAKERGYQYADFYAVLNNGTNRLKRELTLDGLHPTAPGYRLIEPVVEISIKRAIAQSVP